MSIRNKKGTNKSRGEQICTSLVSDGTAVTTYSEPFMIPNASVWALQLAIDDDSTTYAATVSLQASCRPSPAENDAALPDVGWKTLTTAHGWDGWPDFPAGAVTASGDQEDLVDVGVSGARWYRLKIVRSAGSSVIDAWMSAKDNK